MDKSSPVFENFENKMAAMSGRPKINKSTFKIGSGDLGMRVANNERKITTLKNIFKTQRIEIGEKITPKVNILEESLIRTNEVLGNIALQLNNDFSRRLQAEKDLLQKEQQNKLGSKREDKEERLEAKKVAKFVKSTASTVTAPFKNIFQKILDFGKLFLAGVGVNGALAWLSNPQNLLKFQETLKKITDRPIISLVAFGGAAFIIAEVIGRVISGFKKFIFTLITFPFDLIRGKAFKKFLPGMQKLIKKAGRNTMKGKVLKEVAEIGIKKGGPKILGALPLIGNFIDIGAAIYRFSKGDIVGGFLSLGSAIPVLGWGVAAVDIAREFGAFEGSILEKQKKPDKELYTGGTFQKGETIVIDEQTPNPKRFSTMPFSGKVMTAEQMKSLRGRGRRRRRTTIEELELPTKFVGNDKTIRQMEPGGSSLAGAAEHFDSVNPSDPYPSEFAFFMEDIV
tara:strand:+ start:741 stop:2102 length:1362 start_codon:yes stop_codon:yes gene_type:complete